MTDSSKLRVLDRYLGVPICRLFSGISLLKPRPAGRRLSRWGAGPQKPPVSRVLLIELFEMGASIMAYSSIRHLKHALNDPDIYVLCMDNIRQAWEVLQEVPERNILTLNGDSLISLATSIIRQALRLRRKRLDLIIDFELFTRISSIIAFMIRAKRRAGFHRYEMEGLYRGTFYDRRCSFNQNAHIAKNYLALTKTALQRNPEYPSFKGRVSMSDIELPEYRSDSRVRTLVTEKIRGLYPAYNGQKLIVVCPDVGRNIAVRNYPKESFVYIIKKLLSCYPDRLVVLTGVRENLPTCSHIFEQVNEGRCLNFCGRTASLQELMELLLVAEIYIGNDNGPAHFASLTPIKILALFSTDSPFIYGPLGNCVILYTFYHCSPCVSAFNHKRTRCRRNLCLQSLEPDMVLDFAVKMLENSLSLRTVNNEIPYLV